MPQRFRLPDEFTPKLVSALREGISGRDLRADAIAGLTVAVVALPLSMAIAIASGVPPERGLYTAIIGGLLVSALGGSRLQVGGPAGAFIVLIYSIVERNGYDGLVLATMMAGVIMIIFGAVRGGGYIKYIPYPVTVGFTAGIAVIIFASQIKELLGLDIVKEPAALLPKLQAIAAAIGTINPLAIVVAAATGTAISVLRRYRPAFPGMLVMVALAALATFAFGLDIATIGSRFGAVPSSLPSPSLPAFDLERMQRLLPDAFSIALLAAIESLLCAVVADSMSGRRHRPNGELVGQGIANIAAVIFGGIPVTGTIARTATNVRAGAKTPVSGMLHSVYLLLFMAVAAPLAAYIPLAALGAVLAIVAWNMAERHEFLALLKSSRGDAIVLLTTFFLTIFVDLTMGIGIGVILGAFLFMQRMAEHIEIAEGDLLPPHANGEEQEQPVDPDFMIYKITGILFFGGASRLSLALNRIGRYPKVLVIDVGNVTVIDSTAAKALHSFERTLHGHGSRVAIVGASPQVRRVLMTSGLREPEVSYAATIDDAHQRLNAG